MDGIVRVRTIAFTPDRMPMLRRIRLGYEGDNLVERLEFDLPEIAQGQTATLMITGAAEAVKLERTDEGRYAVNLTKDMIGPDGEREAYVRIDGAGEKVWQSAPMRMVTGALPDVEEDIEKQYPTAVGQMLTAMAEHSGEMAAQEERVEQAAQRAEEAAERAEAGGGGSGSGVPGKDGGYYQPSVTDGVLSWTPSKADMPSVPASDVRGPAGQDGQPGKDGADGAPGAPGKTAYQYAQDGGYTGTEAEFAEKMAQEIPEAEGEYELINSFAIAENGALLIDMDSSGKPFELTAAAVRISCGSEVSEGTFTGSLAFGSESGSLLARIYFSNWKYPGYKASETNVRLSDLIGECDLRGRITHIFGMAADTGGAASQAQYFTGEQLSYAPDRAIAKVYTVADVPKNAIVSLYGIRRVRA